jgi:hypothetical protein
VSPGDEGYVGPAQLLVGDTTLEVAVNLRGMFQPIDGRYHWYGRVDRHAEVDELVRGGTTVALRTPYGQAQARLSDVDPWGRYRVTGSGRPPFPTEA